MNLASALSAHQALFQKLATLEPQLQATVERCAAAVGAGNKLMFCGNGGSAGDAQHLAAQLVGRLMRDRRALPGMALSNDAAALTCIGDDFGFEEIFSRQINALGRAGDVLFALSATGNSDNLIRAVEVAKARGILTVGLLGHRGGQLAPIVDLAMVAPSDDPTRVQEAHLFLGHVICAALEKSLGIGGW